MPLCQRSKDHHLTKRRELSQNGPQARPHAEAQRFVAFSALMIQLLKQRQFL
jgi:hypothetical protein